MKILYIESLSRDPLQVGCFILKFSFSANNHEAKILKLSFLWGESFKGRDVFTFEFFKDFFNMDRFLTSLFITVLLLFSVLVFLAMRHMGSQLPGRGLNLYPLHWKTKSQPLDQQESPYLWALSLSLLSEFPKHVYVLFLFLYYRQRLSGIRECDHGPFFVFLFVLPHMKKKNTSNKCHL